MGTTGDRSSSGASVAHWWHQRLTAVALIPLGLWLAFAVLGIDLGSRAALVGWIAEPLHAILLGLLAIAGAYHSWLGVRVVLEDYVPDAGRLRVSLGLSLVAHLVAVAVCLYAILRIAFGVA
jgi:succinate dehydrogenase / fumarate reductase membrane anchor subunit